MKYKIELWTVLGDFADAYYDRSLLPDTEALDTAQLIGYLDLCSVIIHQAIKSCLIFAIPTHMERLLKSQTLIADSIAGLT
ncbi:MAG: hypothetical protein FWG81_08085 [Betaproteobacteria bacterium]|nr:hypothetical protein [Betaproteobacteria bacterium]